MGCGDVFGGMDPLMQDWFLNLEMRGFDLDLGLLRYFRLPWRRIRRRVGKMLVGRGLLSLGLRVESLIWGVRGLRLRMIRGLIDWRGGRRRGLRGGMVRTCCMDYVVIVESGEMAGRWGMSLDGWMCVGWSLIERLVVIDEIRWDESMRGRMCLVDG